MTAPLMALSYREVANLLPPSYKKAIENNKVAVKLNNLGGITEKSVPSKNYFPVLIVLGILATLGGVFLLLAAHQILPQAANAISNIGIWGEVAGYGTLGVGVLLALVGIVKTGLTARHNAKIREVKSEIATVRDTTEANEMDHFFPEILDEKSMVAVDDPVRKRLVIYHAKQINGELHGSCTPFTYETTADEVWKENGMLFDDKSFIDLAKLGRLVEQERMKEWSKGNFETISQALNLQGPEKTGFNQWNVEYFGEATLSGFADLTRTPTVNGLSIALKGSNDSVRFTSLVDFSQDVSLFVEPFVDQTSTCYFITRTISDDLAFRAHLQDPSKELKINNPYILLKLSAKEEV